MNFIKKFKIELIIFFSFIILFTLFTQWGATSWWSDGARMATIESLVDFHTFSIDNSYYSDTGDKIYFKGHFYSEKPALLQIYASFYYQILSILNIKMSERVELVYFLLTVLTIGISSCLGLVYFYKTLTFFKSDFNWSILLTVLAGAGTLVLPYSTVFNNHVVSGALLVIGFYYLLRINENESFPIISGLLFALAGSIDITIFLFIPLSFIVLYKKPLKTKLYFYLATIPVILIYFFLNYKVSGSFMPPSMNSKLFDYPGSSFTPETMDGLSGHRNLIDLLTYTFHIVLGDRGLLSYTPVLIFSIIGFIKLIKDKNQDHRKEFIFLFTGISLFVLLAIMQTLDFGGSCFGARWYTSIMILSLIPLAKWDILSSKKLKITFFIFSVISIVIAFIGAVYAYTQTTYGLNSIYNCLMELLYSTTIFKVKFFSALIFTISVFSYLFFWGNKKTAQTEQF